MLMLFSKKRVIQVKMQQKAVTVQVIAALGILAVLGGVTAYFMWNPVLPQQLQQQRVRTVVETSVLNQAAYQPMVPLYGYVMVPSTLEIGTDLVGRINRVAVRPGDKVQKGDLLIQVDDTDYRLVLMEVEAELAAVHAQIEGEKLAKKLNQQALVQEQGLLVLSEKRLQRQQLLAQEGVVTAISLENSQREVKQHQLQLTERQGLIIQHDSSIEILQAKKQALEAQMRACQVDLAETKIRAPVSAIVSMVQVAEGSRVEQSSLLQLIPDGAYEIRAQIPNSNLEAIQNAMRKQQLIRTTVQFEKIAYPAHLERLLPEVVVGQIGRQAIFAFDQQEDSEHFAHKMPVYLELLLPPVENSYQISTTALYPDNIIYVLDEAKCLQPVTVERVGYCRDDQGHSLVIVKTEAAIMDKFVMTTHIPNPVTGMQVSTYVPNFEK